MTKKNILMSATGTRKRGYVVAAMGITSLQKIKEEKNASRKMFSSAFSNVFVCVFYSKKMAGIQFHRNIWRLFF